MNEVLAQLLPVGAPIETKILDAFDVRGVVDEHAENGLFIRRSDCAGRVYLSWAAIAAGVRAQAREL